MAISFDVLTHPHIVPSPKKKPIILGESDGNFIFFRQNSVSDVLRHGRKEAIHSERNTMQTTTF